MITTALIVRFEAKVGKEEEVAAFLQAPCAIEPRP